MQTSTLKLLSQKRILNHISSFLSSETYFHIYAPAFSMPPSLSFPPSLTGISQLTWWQCWWIINGLGMVLIFGELLSSSVLFLDGGTQRLGCSVGLLYVTARTTAGMTSACPPTLCAAQTSHDWTEALLSFSNELKRSLAWVCGRRPKGDTWLCRSFCLHLSHLTSHGCKHICSDVPPP